jgi:hypothetical protein
MMMARSVASFDVLMATDCRFPGGSSSSVVEEIQAQHRAGYRTGILHLPSTVLKHPRPFNPKIQRAIDRGQAELVVGVDVVEARLLLARHPTVFTDLPSSLPELDTERVVLAVNQVPVDERGERPYYDVRRVEANLRQWAGRPAIWAPIGPRVRETMVGLGELVDLSPTDWENVIDVESWQVRRAGFVGDRPVIGRASRGHWTKWPDNRDDLLAAYPGDPRYVVRILGGAETPRRLLGGRLPSNWIDHPFNSIPAHEYLAEIDFMVYFHHPGLIEAFGRVVLEAMSAGAVCIVPPYLERLFGDVCRYGRPQDVRGYIDELYADWPAFKERSDRGVDLALERFSYRTHLGRVGALIGPPMGEGAPDVAYVPSTPTTIQRLLVIDAVPDDDPARDAIDGILATLSREPGAVAAVAAERLETVGGSNAVVETFARARRHVSPQARREYEADRVRWLLEEHEPSEVVVLGRHEPLELPDGVDALLVTSSPGGRPAEEDGLAGRVQAAVPAGWRLARAVQAPSAVAAEHDGAALDTLRARAPEPVKQATWRARREVRRLRRSVAKLVQRAKALLRPAVGWARRTRARALASAARRSGLVVLDTDRPGRGLPTAGLETHPDPERLPLTLVVITAGRRPDDVLRRIARCQQISSAFRLTLLAPPSWEPAASRYGYATETLVTEEAWSALGRSNWDAYLQLRISHARHALAPTTVLLAGELDDARLSLLLGSLQATGARLDRP